MLNFIIHLRAQQQGPILVTQQSSGGGGGEIQDGKVGHLFNLFVVVSAVKERWHGPLFTPLSFFHFYNELSSI